MKTCKDCYWYQKKQCTNKEAIAAIETMLDENQINFEDWEDWEDLFF